MLDKKSLEKISESYKTNSEAFRKEFKFSDYSLEEWAESLMFSIPNEVDFKDIVELSIQLDNLFAVCHNNLSISLGLFSMYKRNCEKVSSKAYAEIVNGGQRKTALTLENEVNNQIEDEKDQLIVSEYVCDFWKEQIKKLERHSKTLEAVFWSLKNNKDSI